MSLLRRSVKVFETNLRIMQRQEEKRRLQQQQGAASSTAPAIPPPMTSEEAAARVALIRLFHTLDRNQVSTAHPGRAWWAPGRSAVAARCLPPRS